MFEVITEHSGPQGAGMRTIMFFDSAAVQIAAIRTALAAFWTSLDVDRSDQYQWTIQTTGRTLNDETGVMTSGWVDATVQTGGGDLASQPVPDATQVLIRWGTNDVVGGRFVQGRTYVPGYVTSELSNGNLGGSAVTGAATAAQTLADAGVGLVIWHRPVLGAGGSIHNVNTGSCWNELAVQRRRRG